MALIDVWKKYEHLDQLISDKEWLPETFQGRIILDLWLAIKEELGK